MAESVEGFIRRTAAVIEARDRAGHLGLFDRLCAIFGDDGVDLRATPADFAQRTQWFLGALEALGVQSAEIRLEAVRPLGAALILARVETALHMSRGGRTDPHRELWVLREVDGELRVALAINGVSGAVLAPALGGPRPSVVVPAITGPRPRPAPKRSEALLKLMAATLSAGDGPGHRSNFGLPFVRVDDGGARFVTDAALQAAQSRRLFAEVRSLGGVEMTLALLAERPFGETLRILRVEVAARFGDGAQPDPYQELWIVQEVGGALQINAIVNSFVPRFLPHLVLDKIGD